MTAQNALKTILLLLAALAIPTIALADTIPINSDLLNESNSVTTNNVRVQWLYPLTIQVSTDGSRTALITSGFHTTTRGILPPVFGMPNGLPMFPTRLFCPNRIADGRFLRIVLPPLRQECGHSDHLGR